MAQNKAFVRYANNKAVPGSLIVRKKAPAVGVWKEIPYDLCCDAPLCPQPNYGDWKLVTGGEAGDGVVLVDDPGESDCPAFTFVGPNDDVDNGWVYLTKYFPSTTCLQIDYEWTSFDDSNPIAPPNVDWPVYWTSLSEPTGIPGDTTAQVPQTPFSDTWLITVPGGQWFAIGIYSDDSCCGRGFLQVEICEVECP
jgi:hypothetical protein